MPLFFLEDTPKNKTALISGREAHHISRVLRHEVGDQLKLCTPEGNCYFGTIETISKNEIVLGNLIPTATPPPPFPIHLYSSLLATEKMELIVQKAVELNVGTIQWVICDRSQGSGIVASKWERLEKIALEAQKQCERVVKLEMKAPQKFSELLTNTNHNIFCIEREKTFPSPSAQAAPLYGVRGEGQGKGGKSCAIWIGPEGGWAKNEIQSAKEASFSFYSLGPLVLRAETAAIAAMALTTSCYE